MKRLYAVVFTILLGTLISCGGGSANRPDAPKNVQVSEGETANVVTWDYDGAGATEFVVYRATAGTAPGGFSELAFVGPDERSHTDELGANDVSPYAYGVSARGPDGESSIIEAGSPGETPGEGELRVVILFGGSGGRGLVASNDGSISCEEPGGAGCSADFADGTTITLSVTPNPGSEFTGWGGAGCSGTSSCALEVTRANDGNGDSIIEVTATFRQTGYLLSVEKRGAGDGMLVSSPPGINCGSDCNEVYLIPPPNTDATRVGFASVTPDEGSLFNGWGGACPTTAASSSCVVTMSDDRDVIAYFSEPAPDTYTVDEGERLTVDAPGVLSNDVALEGGIALSEDLVTEPENGALDLDDDGSFVYRHDGSSTQSDSFVYRVSDERGTSVDVRVTLNIKVGNDAPVAEDDVYATPEDTRLTLNAANGVLQNDSDDENDALTAELRSGVDNGTLALNPNGSFSYTPDDEFSGRDTFTYVAKGGGQTSNVATVTINVDNENDAPTASNSSATVLEDAEVDVPLRASDPEGSPLTYSIVAQPGNGTLSGSGATRTYEPDANFFGNDSFTFRVSDGSTASNTATVTLTVTPVNDAPSFALLDNALESEEGDGAQTVPNFVTEVEPGPGNESGQTVTLSVERVGGALQFSSGPSIAANGTLSYTPQAGDSGAATFDLVATDSGDTANGGEDTERKRFTISVSAANAAPNGIINTPTNDVIITAGQNVVFNGSGTDPENQPLSYFWDFDGGAPNSTESVPGQVTFDTAGTYEVTFTVTDSQGLADPTPDTVTVTVNPPSVSLNVDIEGSGTGSVNLTPPNRDCSADCTESYPSGTDVALTASAAAGSSFGGWSGEGCSGAGTCQVTMSQARTVTATFNEIPPTTYTLTVNKNGTGAGTITSSPVGIDCGGDCAQDYNEDTVVTLTANAAAGSSFAGWSGACTNSSGTCAVTMSEARTVTATFNEIPPTQYELTVQRSGDGQGTVTGPNISCGTDCTETYTGGTEVTLTASATAGSSFTGWSGNCSVSGNQCTVVMSQARTVTATFTENPTVVSVEVNPDGPLELEEEETRQLTATVTTTGGASEAVTWSSSNPGVATVDANGVVRGLREGSVTITATSVADTNKFDTVLFEVDDANAPPTARNDNLSTAETTETSGNLFADNGNGADADPDGDTLVVSAVNGGSAGNLTLSSGASVLVASTGAFTYDPNGQFEALDAGETGSDSFTYMISDGELTDTATVIVTVIGVNSAPTAEAGLAQSVPVNTPVQLSGSGTDPEGGALSYNWNFATNPDGSSLDDPALAAPSFTPTLAGDYTLELVVTDPGSLSSQPDPVTVSVSN